VGAVQHLVEGDDLTGVCRHSTHARGNACLDAALHLVVRGVVADGEHQHFPLVLVRVGSILSDPDRGAFHILVVVDGRRTATVTASGCDCRALGSVNVAGELTVGTVDAPTLEVELRSVGKGVLHRVVVEVLVDERHPFSVGSIVSTTRRLRLHGPAVLHPRKVVDVVNVEVVEAAAARPEEAVESANLILKVAHAIWLGRGFERGRRTVHSVSAKKKNLAKFTILHPLVKLLQTNGVSRHQTYADLKTLLLRESAQLQHLAAGRTIGSDRLLHEDVQFLLDGVLEVDPSECGRGGENDHVARSKAVHGLLVGVEAQELSILGNVHLVLVSPDEAVVAAVESIFEDVGHCDQLHRPALGKQSVLNCSTATSTAAYDGDPNLIGALNVNRTES